MASADAQKAPYGFALMAHGDKTAVICVECGRKWNAARIADPRNQAYLDEHGQECRRAARKVTDAKKAFRRRMAMKHIRGERMWLQLLTSSTARDHSNGA